MLIPGRHGEADNSDYRYGFNGMEKDNEVKGNGNSYDFGARMYDSRLGRFFSTDRYKSKFPSQSPYITSSNSPIVNVDVNGDYSVAFHFMVTRRVMLKLGYSKEFATRIAHYASVYADHPDWDDLKIMIPNFAQMTLNEYNPNLIRYDNLKYGSYRDLEDSQGDERVDMVSIHAMMTYWEDITPFEAWDRALYGGVYKKTQDGGTIEIEGAYNVIQRLRLKGENLTEAEQKELGVAIHTVQDSFAHMGARWVTKKNKQKAKALGNKDDHPYWDCFGNVRIDQATKKTQELLVRVILGDKVKVREARKANRSMRKHINNKN